jgi:hypothetical protein
VKLGRFTFAGIGRERELRNEQQAAGDLTQAEIHLSFGVGKHAVVEQTLQETVRALGLVAAFCAYQHHQAVLDRTDGLAVDVDTGTGHPLE